MPLTRGVNRVISATNCSWRGLPANGMPTASTASTIVARGDTWIGRSLRKAPAPRSARKVSPSARSEEHTSELQSLMRISYAVFCLKKKNKIQQQQKLKTSRTKTQQQSTGKHKRH